MTHALRFGIIGTNFVSDSFMEGVHQIPGIEVTAVCSGRKENAIRFAEKYQIPHIFDTYQQLSESGCIDAVYIATPNAMHHEQAMFFLKHSIPVFLEKPFTVNTQQAQELFETAKEYKTYIHDGIMPLYSPNLDVLKDLMKNIGPIRRAVFSFQKYSSRYDAFLRNENPTTFRKELANGAFMDLGIYTIADAIALFGKPKDITSSAYLLPTGVDGLNTAILHYDELDVTIMNSKITNSGILSEIQGEQGLIQFQAPSTLHTIRFSDLKGNPQDIEVSQANPFHHQLVDFQRSLIEGRIESAKVPHQLTLDIIETVTVCRKKCGVIYPQDE